MSVSVRDIPRYDDATIVSLNSGSEKCIVHSLGQGPDLSRRTNIRLGFSVSLGRYLR